MNLPLLLLPGTLCDEWVFHPQIDAFTRAGVAVSVPELTTADSVPQLAADILAAAPLRFAVAGLSLGGIVAAEMYRQAPRRVQGIALVDTNLNAADQAQRTTRKQWDSDVRAGMFDQIVARDLISPLTAFPERYSEPIFKMAQRIGAAAFLRQNAAAANRGDLRAVIAEATVPVLIAFGRLDAVCPPELQLELVESCPTATAVAIPGAGHLATIDQSQALHAALASWLQTCNTNQQTQEGNTHEYHSA